MNIKFLEKFLKSSRKNKTFELLQARLEERRNFLREEFVEKQKETVAWLEEKGIDVDELWHRGTRGVLASVATGLILVSSGVVPENTVSLNQPSTGDLTANNIVATVQTREEVDSKVLTALAGKLPTSNRPLTAAEETQVIAALDQATGFKVAAELDNHRLNTNYGRIGLEQHLPRYPGETIAEHFDSSAGRAAYGKSGMTKNRGAFGYFAPNKFALTPQAVEEEKYYAVVQTFLSTDKRASDWYKYRKVMIVNPQNGHVVIGDIGDSGPAKSTGKNFGGSPELMASLGTYYGNSKTPVLLFFVDDTTGNPVPSLGPL